ncbi:MAG: hypothetical protein HZB55_12920 [Deltaproteobacteria bacterium]|nr:hypothetical protein [Deltaproteobacteria bacterium]
MSRRRGRRPPQRQSPEPGPLPSTLAPSQAPAAARPVPSPLWDGALLLAALAFVVVYQFLTSGLFSTDSFFHIRFAELMREQGTIRSLPSLPFSVHGTHYRDHHWLSHLLQMPFTAFPDLLTGAKISAATFAALAHLVFYWTLRRLGVERPGAWTAFLAVCSPGFLVRLEMARVQSQSLAFLLTGLVALELRRWRLLAVVAFLYVWLYDGFAVLLLMTALWGVAEGIRSRKVPVAALVAAGLGTFLALVVNPYFPENLASYAFNFQRIFLQKAPVAVGGEWGSPRLMEGLADAGVSVVVLAIALAAEILRRRWRVLLEPHVLWALAGLAFYVGARRWIEYLPPLCLLAGALALRGVRLPGRVLAAALVVVASVNGSTFADRLSWALPRKTFEGAASWLSANSRPGDVVFNVDWDRYTMLFFHNPKGRYVTGLDPNYLYYYDRGLYWIWRSVQKAEPVDLKAALARFGARYLVTSARRRRVYTRAEEQGLALRYRDAEARVYELPSGPLPDRPPAAGPGGAPARP